MKLEVRDLSCGYRGSKPVLEHISFGMQEGSVCTILGPNGVGKTTLFRTLLGFQAPLAGSILIDGEDVSKWSALELASRVAYVSQAHVPPFPYKVKDVVMIGRIGRLGSHGTPDYTDFEVAEKAMQVMGIESLRDEVYTSISGGELELVMIARALTQQPKLLVLDEPTAALDYGNTVRVIKKIKELSDQGIAVLMTTHSPDHAFMCDSDVVLLQKDAPMRFGRAADLITERTMRQAYGVDVKIVEFVNSKKQIMRMCAPTFKKALGEA